MANNIRELRKQGQLDEAFELGQTLYAERPDDIWVKRDLAWVCYDRAKRQAEAADPTPLVRCLEELAALELGDEETMMAESVDWLLGKRISRVVVPQTQVDRRLEELRQLLAVRARLPHHAPSTAHSYFRQAVHRAAKDTPLYCRMMDAVGFDDRWMEEDYRPGIGPLGQKMMALVEQLYIGYAKALARQVAEPHPDTPEQVHERVEAFMPRLSALIEHHPEYPYPLYFKAKLLLALRQPQQVSELLLPFVRSKSRDFWVWQTLGEAYEQSDAPLALSCYCRGLQCTTKEEMLVNLRESAARLMAASGDASAARYELERAAAARLQAWHKPSKALETARQQPWFQQAQPVENNQAYYTTHAARAEELLFADQAELILITYVNAMKQIVNFIREGNQSGFFKYSRLTQNPPKVDTLCRVVFQSYSPTGPSRVSWMQPWPGDPLQTPFFRPFSGTVQVRPRGFGFVKDVFVEPRWIEQCGLQDGETVHGVAVRSYDRKKEQYGWRVQELARGEQ